MSQKEDGTKKMKEIIHCMPSTTTRCYYKAQNTLSSSKENI